MGDKDFARRLKALIRRERMTQAELSRLSGVPENTLSRWMTCKLAPSLPNLRAVRRALLCTWEDLLGDEL